MSTEKLENTYKNWGMELKGAKFNIISPLKEAIVIEGQDKKHVENFVFLGSAVPSSGTDVKRRTILADLAFGRV